MFSFNDRIKQLLLLSLVILLIFVSLRELKLFMPGILGAITLYILSRASYFQLVYNRKWKRGRAAWLYLLYYLLILGVPVFIAITLISPKVNAALSDPAALMANIKAAVAQVQQKAGVTFFTEKSLSTGLDKAAEFIPSLINSTANLLVNLILMLFMLFYMLYHGADMERTLFRLIPLKNENTSMLAAETKRLVKANGLGIPLISIIQGLTATLGYFIFGISDFALWGFLTGLFAFFPVVGTMIVWVPLVIYTYTSGQTLDAIGLFFYSVLITGNVDYVARITIMRRMGNVHPVITVLGVIVGLGMFGFIGLVFGPLLLSYIIVLSKIYMNEFTTPDPESIKPKEAEELKKETQELAEGSVVQENGP
jgi:predicted PurR-regulated permease PerM